ncbi:hypothetical protein Gpo141_00005680 [Globisporangium polare]
MRSNRVAFRVLTNRSLFVSIVAFTSGVPHFVFHVKQQLVCAREPDAEPSRDFALWHNALSSGDKRTLEALATLSNTEVLGKRLAKVLQSIMGYALTHTKDLALLDWIHEAFSHRDHRDVTFEHHSLLGKYGEIPYVEWLLRHDELGHTTWEQWNSYSLPWMSYSRIAHQAAEFGRLDLLTFLHESGQVEFRPTVMDVAATNGHLAIVQFLHESRQEGCTTAAMDGAATNGHLGVLQFLHETREDENLLPAIQLATQHGRVKCLKYLYGVIPRGIPREDLVTCAATHGQLECIKFFHANEYFRFSVKAMHYAAIANHLHVVKFLHENRKEGCKVDTLFECDKRELHRVLEFLCSRRPMANPSRAIARAKREGRLVLAAKLEFGGGKTEKTRFLYR